MSRCGLPVLTPGSSAAMASSNGQVDDQKTWTQRHPSSGLGRRQSRNGNAIVSPAQPRPLLHWKVLSDGLFLLTAPHRWTKQALVRAQLGFWPPSFLPQRAAIASRRVGMRSRPALAVSCRGTKQGPLLVRSIFLVCKLLPLLPLLTPRWQGTWGFASFRTSFHHLKWVAENRGSRAPRSRMKTRQALDIDTLRFFPPLLHILPACLH